jgi:methylmalonyl-CoA mutase cobalamin-binding subunit
VARLSSEELAELVREDEAARQATGAREPAPVSPAENDIECSIAFTRALDSLALEAVMRRRVAVFGTADFLDAFAAPLLRRLDDELQAGRLTTAQERVATLTLRRILDGALLNLAIASGAPHLLVAAPVGERQELEALLVATAAAVEGWRVTYLGPDLAADEIAAAAVGTAAEAVGVSVTQLADRDRLVTELRRLRASLPSGVPLLLGGVGAPALTAELAGPGIRVIASLADLRAALAAGARRRAW